MGTKGVIGGRGQDCPLAAAGHRRWLEVTISVPPAHLRAAADTLLDLGSGGVITGVTEFDRRRRTSSDSRVRGFFPMERAAALRQEVPRLLGRSGIAAGRACVTYQALDCRAWESDWQRLFRPVRVGRRLVVVPPWYAARGKRIPIIIKPGMAFGTGAHETTRACLAVLDRLLGEKVTPRALDLGTGSGILAIAMVRLGAHRVIAVDTDPTALASARENLRLNRVGGRVALSSQPLAQLRNKLRRIPLVAANLYAEVLATLESDLHGVLAPGGRLIASGIIDSREPVFLEAFASTRWRSIGRRRRGEWVTLTLEKRASG